MWLHILKKDLRLHWPYVAAVLALKIAAVWSILHMGIFAEPLELVLLHTFSDLAFAVVAGVRGGIDDLDHPELELGPSRGNRRGPSAA